MIRRIIIIIAIISGILMIIDEMVLSCFLERVPGKICMSIVFMFLCSEIFYNAKEILNMRKVMSLENKKICHVSVSFRMKTYQQVTAYANLNNISLNEAVNILVDKNFEEKDKN